jgi:hypothetical protein
MCCLLNDGSLYPGQGQAQALACDQFTTWTARGRHTSSPRTLDSCSLELAPPAPSCSVTMIVQHTDGGLVVALDLAAARHITWHMATLQHCTVALKGEATFLYPRCSHHRQCQRCCRQRRCRRRDRRQLLSARAAGPWRRARGRGLPRAAPAAGTSRARGGRSTPRPRPTPGPPGTPPRAPAPHPPPPPCPGVSILNLVTRTGVAWVNLSQDGTAYTMETPDSLRRRRRRRHRRGAAAVGCVLPFWRCARRHLRRPRRQPVQAFPSSVFRDKTRCDIGKSQPKWTAKDGNAAWHTAAPSPGCARRVPPKP